jgi:Cyclin-dependent kinase regulatory subunit
MSRDLASRIDYSEKYSDADYEYRCVRGREWEANVRAEVWGAAAARGEAVAGRGEVWRVRRHVILPKELAKDIPKGRILVEDEWRALHIQQSRGWEHYAYHGCVRACAMRGGGCGARV